MQIPLSNTITQNQADILAAKKSAEVAIKSQNSEETSLRAERDLTRQNIKNENLKADEAKAKQAEEIKKIEEKRDAQVIEQGEGVRATSFSLRTDDENYEIPTSRETYGLLVLELMDDNEFQAFERATAGMTRGEKMIAAQSLYRLSELQTQNAKATFPQEQNSGYARTINFGEAFARALHLGERGIDIHG
ncbi:MAG: hypothetical protein ACTTJS_02500 [Wolinella sp.]